MYFAATEHDEDQPVHLTLRDPDIPVGYHWIDVARGVPARYDAVVCNPPFHLGRDPDPALGIAFIRAAAAALVPGGRLWLVANRRLPYEAALGAAFARLVDAPRIVMARDMRTSGVELSAAFAEGVTGQGVDVVDAGLGSTDLLYYASGALNLPGAMFTASHNPAIYNGIKFCRAGAVPVSSETGLSAVRDEAAAILDHELTVEPAATPGTGTTPAPGTGTGAAPAPAAGTPDKNKI